MSYGLQIVSLRFPRYAGQVKRSSGIVSKESSEESCFSSEISSAARADATSNRYRDNDFAVDRVRGGGAPRGSEGSDGEEQQDSM